MDKQQQVLLGQVRDLTKSQEVLQATIPMYEGPRAEVR